jgi:hypothetical protein
MLSLRKCPRSVLLRRPAKVPSRASSSAFLVRCGCVSCRCFYGVNEWFGVSPRVFALIDTTISAPLGQLTMVPILVLIAKSVKPGNEATTFAILASLMNLALSASELCTKYLNEFFSVSQQDYSNLGLLMITVGIVGLPPLCALPLLRREERAENQRVR